MKKVFVSLLLALVTLNSQAHEFYVSIFEINYSNNNQRLEITIKVFTDDLESATEMFAPGNLNIGTEEEIEHAGLYIDSYLESTFQLSINGGKVNPEFLGKQHEDDVTYLFLELKGLEKPPKKLGIQCDFLTEVYEDQSNIIHFFCGETKESAVTKRGSPYVSIEPGCM